MVGGAGSFSQYRSNSFHKLHVFSANNVRSGIGVKIDCDPNRDGSGLYFSSMRFYFLSIMAYITVTILKASALTRAGSVIAITDLPAYARLNQAH
jgi:hypothetical protein